MPAPTLISHGIANGGVVGNNPAYVEVGPIDTRGANFFFLIGVGAAAQMTPGVSLITDTGSNTWTSLPGDPPGTLPYGSIEATALFAYVTSPITSATHTFRITTANPGQLHGALEVSAWSNIDLAPFNAQDWDHNTNPIVLGPTSCAEGIVITACSIAWDQIATGVQVPAISAGWTALDSIAADQALFGTCGIKAAYKIIGSTTNESVTWTLDDNSQDACAGLFAFSATSTPPTPPTTTTYPIRRVRRFMLPWDEQNRQKFISRLELIQQLGIGTIDVPNPQVMLRLSKDGAKTWGSEILMSAGAMGEWSRRSFVNIRTRARNPVVELSCSDPVDWQWIQFLADMDEGTS